MTQDERSATPKKVVIRRPTEEEAADASAPASAPGQREPGRRGPQLRWATGLAAVGGAIAAFSVLLPWWTRSLRGIELLDSSVGAVGSIVGIIAICGAWTVLLALAYDETRPGSTLAPTIAAAGALVVVLSSGIAVLAPGSAAAQLGLTVRPAIGSWVALAGGAASLAGSVALYLERR